jgi:hypothetical protein
MAKSHFRRTLPDVMRARLRGARTGGRGMSQFVTTSYRDARDADIAAEHLFAQGYSRADTSIIVTDRTRRSYLGDAKTSPIGAIITGPGSVSKTILIDDSDDVGTPISVGGPLSQEVERGVRNSKRLVELIESLGASRRDAEAAARDVSRGGVFIAIAARDKDLAGVRQLMKDPGSVTSTTSRH